jgi:hypothetical protein
MQEQPSKFAAFIGIDWADRKHDICLQVAGADTLEKSVIEHRPAVIDAWARNLRKRFDGRPVAVCLELSQGPIVSALLEHDFLVIFPVNPSTLAKYRKAFTPSGAKDDPTDAAVALEILRRHPDKLPPLRRESVDMRALRRLVESRRDLVQDRVRLTNRLIYALKAYFPQVLDWFRVSSSYTGAAAPPRQRVWMEPRSITTKGASSHARIETAEPVRRSQPQAYRRPRCRLLGIPSRAWAGTTDPGWSSPTVPRRLGRGWVGRRHRKGLRCLVDPD